MSYYLVRKPTGTPKNLPQEATCARRCRREAAARAEGAVQERAVEEYRAERVLLWALVARALRAHGARLAGDPSSDRSEVAKPDSDSEPGRYY